VVHNCFQRKSRLKQKKQKEWIATYQRLLTYKKDHHGHNPPQKYDKDPALSKWIKIQRQRKRENLLTTKQIELLESINFFFCDPLDHYIPVWMDKYNVLIQYKRHHPDDNSTMSIPKKYSVDPSLRKWVYHQRRLYRDNKLRKFYIEKLNKLDFDWRMIDNRKSKNVPWMVNYQRLIEYNKEATHPSTMSSDKASPPSDPYYVKADPNLKAWIHRQRKLNNSNNLRKERCELLDSIIGFDWDCYDWKLTAHVPWKIMYQRYIEYVSKQNNSNRNKDNVQTKLLVEDDFKLSSWKGVPIQGDKLSSWIGVQRDKQSKKLLKKEQYDLLESIGFDWDNKTKCNSNSNSNSSNGDEEQNDKKETTKSAWISGRSRRTLACQHPLATTTATTIGKVNKKRKSSSLTSSSSVVSETSLSTKKSRSTFGGDDNEHETQSSYY